MRIEDLRHLHPREVRRVGAILGVAVGDALGVTYEFCSPEDVPDGPLEMVGRGRFD
jgi:ADP-ribosylglycohydrolase